MRQYFVTDLGFYENFPVWKQGFGLGSVARKRVAPCTTTEPSLGSLHDATEDKMALIQNQYDHSPGLFPNSKSKSWD